MTSTEAVATLETKQSSQPLVATAEWGYVRLRNEKYTRDELQQWLQRFTDMSWREVFVFFKHETDAPHLALQLQELAG